MAAGFDISQLKGTPLYALAKNANVYGGKSLSKTEMVFFQQQCREMGFDPEKYGLEVVSEDIEGADFKETQKNMEKLTDSINDAYKHQFGKKNNAVATAQGAETKAYAIINTAKEAFTKAHGDNSNFVPDSLGQRPNFTDPQYKDNLTKYVTDFNVWANKVAEQYRNAADMTSKDLAAMIMQNDDANAAMNAGVSVAVGEAVMDKLQDLQKQLEDGTAKVIKEVQIQGGATRVSIQNAKGEVIEAVKTAEGNLMSEVQWQSWYTRDIVIDQGEKTRGEVRDEGAKTRGAVHNEGEKIRDEVRETAQQTQELNGISDKITTSLSHTNGFIHLQNSIDRVNNMRNKILQSNIPYEQKKELLTHLAAFVTQVAFSELELKAEEEKIQQAINEQ